MSRRTIKIELLRYSGTIIGGRCVREAIELVGARSMAHATRKHRTGAIQVPRADLDDVISCLEAGGQRVKIVAAQAGHREVGGRR
jgi:hypothetical protein